MNRRTVIILGVAILVLLLLIASKVLTRFGFEEESAPVSEHGISIVPTVFDTPDPRPPELADALETVVERIAESVDTVTEILTHPPEPTVHTYIEVIDGCGPHFEGTCVNIRSGPSTSSPSVGQLRNGVVLKTSGSVTEGGRIWHKIAFDEWIRYPERIQGEWYVAGEFVRVFENEGAVDINPDAPTSSSKRILVDRSDQKLYAYENNVLFMEAVISTGLDLTPTPRGVFTIYRKTPTRYMQGPLPGISEDYYDLPGVPWNLYFTEEGGAIHGTFWHDKFGRQWSHGCVNLPTDTARTLYEWASLGTPVTVQD